MSKRVTKTGKDSDGDITKLCGAWGSVSKAQTISDINADSTAYYVQEVGLTKVYIHVVDGPTMKYLRTNRDAHDANNLDNLPDC